MQVALFLGVSQLGSPSRYLGIPGAATALIGVIAAIIAGPVTGMAVALIGGMAYFAFLTEFGGLVAWRDIVMSILLWTLAAVVAGLAGDWVRHDAYKREALLGQMLSERESLAESLGTTNVVLEAQNEELVSVLQEALLDIPQQARGVEFGHLYRSATQKAKVGGDFHDVFEAKDGRIALLIGDVSGHGLEAARTATLVKDVVHAFSHQFRRPRLVLRETNRLLVEKNLPGFVTAFFGLLDPESGILVYSSAGHPPPLVAREGQVELLQSVGLPLGVDSDARYRNIETEIQEGSLLLLYTDGINETRQNGDLYGEARLAAALERLRARPIEALPALLLDEALAFSGGDLRDNVALLAVSYVGLTIGEGT